MNAKPQGNGDCYEAAAKLLLFGNMPLDARLVHGNVIGQGPVAGIRYGHAWVEIDDIVFDHSNGRRVVMRREEYYRLGQIKRVRRYHPIDARIKLMTRLHYGPWRQTKNDDQPQPANINTNTNTDTQHHEHHQ
jgi:hypothetical protein